MEQYDFEGFKRAEFGVVCKTAEEVNAFLSRCWKARMRWRSGAKATDFSPYNLPTCICFKVGKARKLSWGEADDSGDARPIVAFSDVTL